MKCRILFLGFLLGISEIKGNNNNDVKSSLTFVIDDTGSMYNDIDEVKEGANAIFDTVLRSNSSQIEDFVLVTFNDPAVSLRTITKQRQDFKQALAAISVNGGGDCPEMAMGGIELALERSRDASLLYVFTDASAKDYTKFAKVEALSQKKQSQVVFVLTGQCGGRTDSDYLVYHKLAKATSGQVFHLQKSEVGKILKYVAKTIESRKNVIASKSYPAGYGHYFNVEVDSHTKELVIAVSGRKPSVKVTDSAGTKMPTEDITRLSEIAVVKVLNIKLDVYKVEVGSETDTQVDVSGTTSVHFQHGFSVLKPTSISDTSSRPVPGEKSHLSIKLTTEGGNVELKTVQILDMDDNVILEEPLRLVDKKEEFYTTEPIDSPNHMFKIAIKGYDTEIKTFLTRISLTPIKPQDPAVAGSTPDKVPVVTIDGGDEIDAEYNKPLQLKCKVSGYPKPDIVWESDDPTGETSQTVSTVELPSDFISVLEIKTIKNNATYTCRAVNKKGSDAKSIKTKINTYFNILELPKDTTIEYGKKGEIRCKVDALPSAAISWFKNYKSMRTDKNIELSSDNSVLYIRSMAPYIADNYVCEARNGLERKIAVFKVSISGVEPPKIDKSIYYITTAKYSAVDIHCNVIKGKPKPTYTWLYNDQYSSTFTKLNVTSDTIHIDNVASDDKAIYRCMVENVVGQDEHDIDLIVEYPPVITKSVNPSIVKNNGDVVTLECPVTGVPSPDVVWTLNGSEILGVTYKFFEDNSIRFIASLSERGDYECEASNEYGIVRVNTKVDVIGSTPDKVPVVTMDGGDEIDAEYNKPLQLKCKVSGYPKPDIVWESDDPTGETSQTVSTVELPSDFISVLEIKTIKNNATYTCRAVNKKGSDAKSIKTKINTYFNILELPKDTTIEYGKEGEIRCKVDALPSASISWFKNYKSLRTDKNIELSSDNSVLYIRSMAPYIADNYVCEARNGLERKIAEFKVSISGVEPPKIDKSIYEITTAKYSAVDIHCNVIKGKPKPTYTWLYNDQYSSTFTKLNVTSDTIHIDNVASDDKAIYRCMVENVVGQDEHDFDLIVEYPPVITKSVNPSIVKNNGDVVTLECPVTGVPSPDVVWTLNGSEILGVTYKFFEDNSIRFIASLSERGNYECEASNEYGIVRVNTKVDVIGSTPDKVPVVTMDGGDEIDAEYNKPLQLKCKVSGYPKPDIVWESDDPTGETSQTVSTVELPSDFISVLEIKTIKNNATYTCRAVNKKGSDAKSIKTKINTYFNILELPKDTTIEYGKKGEIRCKVDALPSAAISWFKNYKSMRTDKNIELSSDNSVLYIRSMAPYIADNYVCEARNGLERKIAVFKVSISGVEPPKIDKSIYEITTAKYSAVDIHCNVIKGKPKPTYTWLYNDQYSSTFTKLNVTSDTIHIDNVASDDKAIYRCMVENVVGQDEHDFDLIVEYPPVITKSVNPSIVKNNGDVVTLECPVTGVPSPDVVWTLNGSEILGVTYKFFEDNSIRFIASLSERGDYECEASNEYGIVRVNTKVDVIVPVDIEPLKRGMVKIMVGKSARLPCRADGFPKPVLSWIFHSKDPKIKSKVSEPSDGMGSLALPRIQQIQDGFYTCVATNTGGSKNITYEVIVLAPPFITYSAKQFKAVLDDKMLRVPCKATGNPKPKISWMKSGFDMPAGEWYDIAEDGSLIIKNVDEISAGEYVCNARNKYGAHKEAFTVIVEPYAKPEFIMNTFMLDEGKPAVIPCSVPHQKTDRLRWFKDGRMIAKSELQFTDVTPSDTGIYTCRVSSFDGAKTGTTKVVIGSKPRFIYNNEKANTIEFIDGGFAVMDCRTHGKKPPEIKWLRDGAIIDFKESIYIIEMNSPSDKGRYTCIASNEFGSAQQEFVVKTMGCALDINADFNGNAPLMVTPYLELPKFEVTDGHINIPKDENIVLYCPTSFTKVPKREIMVTCENDKEFIYQGARYSYVNFKCKNKVEANSRRTRRPCSSGNSELVDIGFDMIRKFVLVYQMCLDLTGLKALYTKHNLQPTFANVLPNYSFNNRSHNDLNKIFDCNYQNNEISAILGLDFHMRDGCCFAKRQLVNPKDVAPGLSQIATYTSANVVPHWSTCNSQNWDDVEQRIRTLAVSANHELQVWTGIAQDLQLPDTYSSLKTINLPFTRKEQPVPTYLWKVVQDPASRASLAIIQVNVPDLKLSKVRRHHLCRDVCGEVDWMQNRRWRNVQRGYTYCCQLSEFERAFRLSGIFPPYTKLLKDVTFVSEYYLHV